jgi:arsenate reductase (glutaredoxin)
MTKPTKPTQPSEPIELICTRTCTTCRKAVALLDEKAIPYRYREYTREPLIEDEIREILGLLGIPARDLLRTKDSAYRELGLADQPDDELIRAMARHPTLIQRPIGWLPRKAVLGRPPERLLDLAEGGASS